MIGVVQKQVSLNYFYVSRRGKLKDIFLGHYQGDVGRLQTHVRERPGIWLHREPALEAAQ